MKKLMDLLFASRHNIGKHVDAGGNVRRGRLRYEWESGGSGPWFGRSKQK